MSKTAPMKKLSLSKMSSAVVVVVGICVCLYTSTVEASVCNDVLDILECTDQGFCVLGTLLDASAKFLYLCFLIYHISPPKRKLQQANKVKSKQKDL